MAKTFKKKTNFSNSKLIIRSIILPISMLLIFLLFFFSHHLQYYTRSSDGYKIFYITLRNNNTDITFGNNDTFDTVNAVIISVAYRQFNTVRHNSLEQGSVKLSCYWPV